MKSTVQTEDSEHIPQTVTNGGTSTEDYEEQKPKKRNSRSGQSKRKQKNKKTSERGKKQDFLRKAVAAVFCVAAVIAADFF